jgi:hypothetical protein
MRNKCFFLFSKVFQGRIETPPEMGDESCLIVIGASYMCQVAEYLPE